MSITQGLVSVNATTSTFAEAQQNINSLKANEQRLDTYGLGVNSVLEVTVPVTADDTLNRLNANFQFVAVTSSVAAITVTLPLAANLVNGDQFFIADVSANANTYNITINTNSNNVNGSASNITISKARGSIHIYYYASGEFFIKSTDIS
jgi:hypothetical protein|tara:strand:- start:271 stop:720 length:450 start_codon:yes stop_codon:yes gene_type:complete